MFHPLINRPGARGERRTSRALRLETLESRLLPSGFNVLVFSKTAGYRHDSIPDGIAAIQQLSAANGFNVDATEDSSAFTDANLSQYQAVIFLLTTGTVLDPDQKAAFERFIEAGNGYVGVHSAADTEYDWAWYGQLMGAYFDSHPDDLQPAQVDVLDHTHASTVGLPDVWTRTDEWFNYQTNPRDNGVTVLATVDETTYYGGTMGDDHPIMWYHDFDGGRAWYTGMGHTSDSYYEPLFLQSLLGGIQYAAGMDGGHRPGPGGGSGAKAAQTLAPADVAQPELSVASRLLSEVGPAGPATVPPAPASGSLSGPPGAANQRRAESLAADEFFRLFDEQGKGVIESRATDEHGWNTDRAN
jgi:type 1 glutamine amidotransferase